MHHIFVQAASAFVVLFSSVMPSMTHAAEPASPEMIIQTQLDAYNARSIDAFLATYTDDIEIFTFPATPLSKGQDEMRKRYTVRFADPILHCIIVKRLVMGNTVIDHERIRVTLPEGPGVREAIAIYEVRDGKIRKVTFISGKAVPGATL